MEELKREKQKEQDDLKEIEEDKKKKEEQLNKIIAFQKSH
jgi:hypothetical protein